MDNVTRLLMQGAAGAAGGSTYVDDVFSTYIYDGDGNSSHPITNNIDLSTNGGMTWIKRRDGTYDNWLMDSVRGGTKMLSSNRSDAEATNQAITSFNSDGFTLGNEGQTNASGTNFASWTFRKATGFFDIVTYTGNNGNDRQIAHNLGSVPGCIIIKVLTKSDNWAVYHRGMDSSSPENYGIFLNSNAPRQNGTNWWNNTAPTSTHFTVGGAGWGNENGETFVAYIFAGGESNVATGPSVNFDGNDYLSLANTSDLEPGSGDFTIEAWVKPDDAADGYDYVFSNGWEQQLSWHRSGATTHFESWFRETQGGSYVVSLSSSASCAPRGAWNHVAVVRYGNVFTLYVNGNAESSVTHTGPVADTASDLPMIGRFGGAGGSTYPMQGQISNFRYVKGTAVYTSSFRPPTAPLTNITNTKLLCCNSSSVTGSTVTPGTITNNGSTASTDSPFDDPEGYKFGEEGDQNLIKTGRYIGNGSSTTFQQAVDINIGWEPQWLLIKCNDLSSENWFMVDSMRGIVTGYPELTLSPNADTAEASINAIDLTSTGFRTQTADDKFNGDGHEYIYMAIRRPDGYVGKPPEAGNEVFAMDTGNASTTIPVFDSGFPVDFAMNRAPASATAWYTTARLMQDMYLLADSSSGENQDGGAFFDSNVGWAKDAYNTWNTTYQSWMWKRHAGFDVVTYTGTGANMVQSHSLGRVPEMVVVKKRNSTQNWYTYHFGLNGGTNPELKTVMWNSADAEDSAGSFTFNNTAPTSTVFSLASSHATNGSGDTYIALLFASVEGISKCGYYAGSSSNITIDLGFTPRFLIFRNISATANWAVFDTLRGITDSNSPVLNLNTNNAQQSFSQLNITTNGIIVETGSNWVNTNGYNYIYYAHA